MSPQLTDEDLREAAEYFGPDILDGRYNETRWLPGESGNPRGRPIEPDGLTEMLMYRLRKAGAKALADKLIGIALNGTGATQLAAIQYIYDRIEGKPRQAVLTQSSEEPVIVKLLRGLVDDKAALEGHRRQLPGPRAKSEPATEVRTAPGD